MLGSHSSISQTKSSCLIQGLSIAVTTICDTDDPLKKSKNIPNFKFSGFFAALLVLLVELFVARASLPAQARQPPSAIQIVNEMVQAETAAWKGRQHFEYRKEERSNNTKGHLWTELVVETSDGPMQRLISEDGRPLSMSQERAEDKRIDYLANHPREFRRENRRRKEDESRMPELLKEVPQIFLFQYVGTEGDYTRIAFEPNPSFQEKSYQDRVVHAMSGVLLIHMTDMRLCELDVHLNHRVDFGFGLLGEISDKTHFSLARAEVSPGLWKTTKVRVHFDGTILLLKNISRDVDSSQYDFKVIAHNLTVAQAAAMVRSKNF